MHRWPFRSIWLIDFEYNALPGENPNVVCMVAKEFKTGQIFRLWQDEMKRSLPAFLAGGDSLFVAYAFTAEASCFLALNWPLPDLILDLYVEFRCLTNDLWPFAGNGLLGALAYFGLPSISVGEKESMRALIMSGGPWDEEQKSRILTYCESDVEALFRLLPVMAPKIDLPRALLRGKFMGYCSRVESAGIPIDVPSYDRLVTHWDRVEDALIHEINLDYYRPYRQKHFKHVIWEWYLVRSGIPWPRTSSGRLDLRVETFERMSGLYPQLIPLMELRKTLGQMRLKELPIGSDGRNRFSIRPFAARTSRSQPRAKEFILGSAAWLRGLIKPRPGYGIGYIDYEQQEFGIGAAISGDELMQEAYLSADPYLTLAEHAGVVPRGATKESHPQKRVLFKELVLATQYGVGTRTFAERIKRSRAEAERLIEDHKRRYKKFWAWSDAAVRYAALHGRLWSPFGWVRHYRNMNEESARNFPIQACGAEMLRLAIMLGFDAGVQIIAPLHDALMVEFVLEEEEETIWKMRTAMRQASQTVLAGFPIRTDAMIVRYPERFIQDRGKQMWDLIWAIIDEIERGKL